jgi:murein DD-endopeptidase MepM/ murein hydrolase activator NlpD
LYRHLKNGSISVKVGNSVQQGQPIAAIGASGTANIPHLHYELRNGPGIKGVEGLPSHFQNFRRILGARSIPVVHGIVDTGDIVVQG